MASITYNGFRFCVYSNDHLPPHVDAIKDNGSFKIFLNLRAGLPEEGEIKGTMSDVDAARAYRLVMEHHGEMVKLWRSVHGEKEKEYLANL